MITVDPFSPQETRFRRDFLIGAAAVIVPMAALLISMPEIDLSISNAIWEVCPGARGGRPWCAIEPVMAARQIFMGVFFLVAIATAVATVRIVLQKRQWLGYEQARCWFMIAVLIVGPGIVANLIFKDNLGRARPRDIVEFGGTKSFTPPLVPSAECARNCSFISGEASSNYAAFFALALLIPRYRMALLAAGIALGTLAGGIRIIQGAHFVSDVLFAGIFMAITVSLLHIAFIGIWRDPRRTLSTLTGMVMPIYRAGTAWVRG